MFLREFQWKSLVRRLRRHMDCLSEGLGQNVNETPKTRHSLLLRLADAGDGEAWSEFLEVYERAVFRYVISRGLQPADAEDVTQRVLEAVLVKSRSWDATSGGSFSAWLFRVAKNLAAKSWNERVRMANDAGSDSTANWLEQFPEPSEEEKTVFQLEYRKAMFHWAAQRVKDQFKTETWDAFWLTTAEQLDAASAAQQLGVTKSAVYVSKCRVLAKVKTEIERFEREFSHDGSLPEFDRS